MELLIEVTKSFEKDLRKLSQKEQDKVKDKINVFVDSFRETGSARQLYRIQKIPLPSNLSSSLFVYKIDINFRVILTFEKDPLFNQTVLTLFRVIKHSELDRSFKSVYDSLYQSFFNSEDKVNGGD